MAQAVVALLPPFPDPSMVWRKLSEAEMALAKKLHEEISSIAQRIKELKEGSADVDHYEGRNGQSQSALADVAGATAASAPIALEVQ